MFCASTQTTNHSLFGRNTSEVIFLRLVEEIQNTTCRSSTWKQAETRGEQRTAAEQKQTCINDSRHQGEVLIGTDTKCIDSFLKKPQVNDGNMDYTTPSFLRKGTLPI